MKWLVVGALLWPLMLATALWQQIERPASWSTSIYLAASRICHQRDDRSFHTHGVRWPVCGRCSGLYAAAPIGAIAAASARRRRRRRPDRPLVWLAVAAVPSMGTLLAEWLHLATVSNAARALSAVPLGAAIAFAIVRVAAGRAESIR
jgi:uncharacterized membrane protein